jgi:hypothetical protein
MSPRPGYIAAANATIPGESIKSLKTISRKG